MLKVQTAVLKREAFNKVDFGECAVEKLHRIAVVETDSRMHFKLMKEFLSDAESLRN